MTQLRIGLYNATYPSTKNRDPKKVYASTQDRVSRYLETSINMDVALLTEAPDLSELEHITTNVHDNWKIIFHSENEDDGMAYPGSNLTFKSRKQHLACLVNQERSTVFSISTSPQKGGPYKVEWADLSTDNFIFRIYLLHLPSKLSMDINSQAAYAGQVTQFINETLVNSKKVFQSRNYFEIPYLICGDFNMNPWEPGMCRPGCFHAPLSLALTYSKESEHELAANDRVRTLKYIKHPYFYNPAWRRIGAKHNAGNKVYGSFHLKSLGHGYDNTKWNILDQFLLNLPLLELLSESPTFMIEHNPLPEDATGGIHFPVSLTLAYT